MDTGKDLNEVLMSLREATAPDAALTDDQVDVLDIVDQMDDQMQAMLRSLGEVLLEAIDEFGVDPTNDS